jgi:hypothetical protein
MLKVKPDKNPAIWIALQELEVIVIEDLARPYFDAVFAWRSKCFCISLVTYIHIMSELDYTWALRIY